MQKKGLLVLAVALLGLASCGVSSSPEPSSSLEAPSSSPDSVVSSSDPSGHSSDLTQIYTVTFKDWDDSLLASVDVEEGGTAVYPYDAPSREGDAQYTYSFSGWDRDLSNVTSSFETVAQYSTETNRYTVTFVNHDGTVLQEGEWDYGSTPSYSGETPTKESDALYTYSFSGWSPEITPVTGDATYAATYTAAFHFSASDGDVIEFGEFPQTVVEDSAVLSGLASASDSDGDGWLDYEGKEYAYLASASPYKSTYTSASGNVTFATGSAYYFEVEPLLWKVLDASSGLLMSLYELEGMQFYTSTDNRTVDGNTVYPNNYEYSNIRAWMNGLDGSGYNVSDYSGKGFYDLAFAGDEKALIQTTSVDNSASSTGNSSNSYACEDTEDKVFALSCADVTNSSYGFNSSYNYGDSARRAQVTDYALATGAFMSTNTSYLRIGYWWLRSPFYSYPSNARDVSFGGYSSTAYNVGYSFIGARPALKITVE